MSTEQSNHSEKSNNSQDLRVEANAENTLPHNSINSVNSATQPHEDISDRNENSNLTAIFAILIALSSAGLSAWLYWQQTQLQAGLDNRQVTLLNTVEDSQEAINQDISKRVNIFKNQINAQFAEQDNELQVILRQMTSQTDNSSAQSVLIDIKYLLTLASRKLFIEQDKEGTISTLRLALNQAESVKTANWFYLKQAIADDLGRVESLTEADVEGIFFALTELIRQIMYLPLNAQQLPPASSTPESKAITTEPSMDNFKSSFDNFLGNFLPKKRNIEIEAIYTPTQESNIRQNLISKLNQVQWAAIHRKAEMYRVSIQQATDWIGLYYRVEDKAVKNILLQLAGLHEQTLARNYNKIQLEALFTAEQLLQKNENQAKRETSNTAVSDAAITESSAVEQ